MFEPSIVGGKIGELRFLVAILPQRGPSVLAVSIGRLRLRRGFDWQGWQRSRCVLVG